MKKAFDMPKIVVEQFVPNEYVAACGDKNKVYKFVCDAGDGVSGNVWQETNGVPGLQLTALNVSGKPDTNLTQGLLVSYHACGKTHEAPTSDYFYDGYFIPLDSLTGEPVIIWTDDGTNVHATKNIYIDTWDTAKS